MKDSEFIELLNLYLDHEITRADAARLEAEVQSNPAHRRVYQDYCRMQKACRILAQDFGTEAADTSTRKVVAFDTSGGGSGRRLAPMYFVGALAAAAAAVAVMFVGRTPAEPAAADGSAAVVPSRPAAAPVAIASTTEALPDPTSRHPRSTGLSLRTNPQADVLTLASDVRSDPHFAWMQDVRLNPVQNPNPVEQLRFEVNPNPVSENRTYSSNQPLPADVPWIAIRFQK